MHSLHKNVFSLFLLLCLPLCSNAQQAGHIDLTFNPFDTLIYGNGTGVSGVISDVIVQPDSKILISGSFSVYGGSTILSLGRMQANSGIDSSFVAATRSNLGISKPKLLANGQLLAIERYNTNGSSYRIIRLNSDGTRDLSFADGGITNNGGIYELATQSDGKIIVVGSFPSYNGAAYNKMVRLNDDGSVDFTFTSPASTFIDGFNNCRLQSDGKIVIAVTTSSTTFYRFDSDGTQDALFSFYEANAIQSMAIQSDDKIIYSTFGSSSVRRLLADGTMDTGFTVFTSTSGNISFCLPLADGHILAGGNFNSTTKKSLALLKNTGEIETTFTYSDGGTINSASVCADGSFIIGTPTGVDKLTSTGAKDVTFLLRLGSNALIKRSVIQPDGKIIIGGIFSAYNNEGSSQIRRLYPNGSIDHSFASIISATSIEALLLQPDGKVLVAGVGLTGNYNIKRLNADGNVDATFNPTNSDLMLRNVYAVALQPDGKILLSYTGSNNGLLRLNTDGSTDGSFLLKSTGSLGSIIKIVVQPDNKILIGGWFNQYDGKTNNFARLNSDGSLDQTFKLPESTITDGVLAICLQPDGKIVLGGNFNYYKTTVTGSVLRLNPDGTLDPTFSKGNVYGPIRSIVYQADGKLIIGGINMAEYGGFSRNRIVRVFPSGIIDLSFDPGVGVHGTIENINLNTDGSIIAVGSFDSYDHIGRGNIVKIDGEVIDNCFFADLSFKNVLDVTCTNVGHATANIISDFPPFTYTWGNSTDPNNPYQEFISGGVYPITVIDDKGCISKSAIVITGPRYLNGYDASAKLTADGFRPGVPSNVRIYVYNEGCLPASGKIKLVLSSQTNYNSSVPSVAAISGDTLIWDFTDLTPTLPLNFVVTLTPKTTATIGTLLCFNLLLTNTSDDLDFSNNTKNYCLPVVNSYDPNDKQVFPIGVCNNHYIKDDQVLTYTLRFQNTGTASANDIYVTDSLSDALDISSVRVIEHSHDVYTEALPDNTLKFHFDNIFLPAASADVSASYGLVVFEITPFANPQADVLIDNKASIYFDYNAPIITNTVFHTLTETIPTADISVTQDASALIANASNATFQWINCSVNNTFVSNATTNLFTIPDANSYAVIVEQDGCKDTSSCYITPVVTSSEQMTSTTGLAVYPNPGNGFGTVVCVQDLQNATIKILNTDGNVVFEKNNVSGNSIKLDISKQANGLYFLEVWEASNVKRIKIVKD